jgi:hypothetical protein
MENIFDKYTSWNYGECHQAQGLSAVPSNEEPAASGANVALQITDTVVLHTGLERKSTGTALRFEERDCQSRRSSGELTLAGALHRSMSFTLTAEAA